MKLSSNAASTHHDSPQFFVEGYLADMSSSKNKAQITAEQETWSLIYTESTQGMELSPQHQRGLSPPYSSRQTT
jgi:hypothetical protein